MKTKLSVRNLGKTGLLFLCLVCGLVQGQVNISTYHNDNSRTGQNTQETILTPANVNSRQFGKLFSIAMDGDVYAQPLYLAGVTIAGGIHNVVYVATEHDSVYAIDADLGTVYKQVSLIPPGGSTVSSSGDLSCSDLVPEIGITGTPVIDTTTKTIYVLAKAKTASGSIVQHLHALDVATLTEKFGGPIQIAASVAGTAADGNGSTVVFNARLQHQRAALLLANGHVLIAWGSHCDIPPWHGWVMSYNAGTLAQESVFNTSANGQYGGIWMSGGGLAADSGGNIYFATGNGTWTGTTDYGDTILKLGPPSGGSFPVSDYFTPWNQSTLEGGDWDVSSGGLVLLPTLSSGQQLLAQQGKTGTIFLLDRNNMGKYCVNQTPACSGNDPNAVQEIVGASGGIWGSPAYWNGNLYWAGIGSSISAYSFNANNSGLMSTSPTSQSAQIFGFAAPTPSISANGTTNGILWALDGPTEDSTCQDTSQHCLGLYAYDATNLSSMLYNSSQAANDPPGLTVKFATPIISNGKVYLGTQNALVVYGLLSTSPTVNTPTISPASGNYNTLALSVSLRDNTPGAVIYYTTDGSTPTTASSKYSTPFSISASATIKAIAVASGYANSAVASATYTITSSATTPVSVNLSSADNVYGIVADGSAVPNGGLDGAGNAYSGNLLGTSISWSGATFTLGAAGTLNAVNSKSIALPAGNYSTLSLLATAVNGNQANQTFIVTYSDGTTSSFTQSLSDWLSPQSYAGESIASTMAYRVAVTGGTRPGPWYLYGYSFALNSAKSVASIRLPNNRNVVVLAVDLTPPQPAATPTFSPPAGNYSSTQSVSLSDSTPGAVIYYTTDGSTTPTTSSAKYSTALSISATTTIQAIAAASGYANSTVASATYTISSSGPVSVNLSSADNVYGIVANGSAVPSGGLDGAGYAYSGNLLGSSISWSGATFTLGAAGTLNAVNSKTIALPAGNYSALSLLATAVNGNQTNQTFVVTYSDGTTSSFTQSLSDWFTPQSYAAESIASTMAYRITPTGATGSGPCYLYGYSFPLNSAKSVASITLPNNRNVVVLAVDLTPTGSGTQPAATPTFSPPAGNYSSAQSVSLSDTTPGAVIYYTTDGSTPTTSSPKYSTPLSISATTTIKAIAVASGYANSTVASATYTISSSGPVSVNLSSADNVYGIVANGSAVPSGGLDGAGYAYSGNLLGSSISWSGATFTLGAAGTLNAVNSKTIALPAGNYSALSLLATAVNGNQANQTFIVTYSDGTTSTFTQSLSDWFTPQSYAAESIVSTMAYRITPTGATGSGPCYLYGYSFALNSAKSVTSITLPNNRNVVVLAVDLTPTGSGTQPAATPTFSPPAGNYSSTQSVSLSDTTAGAVIYYTTDGSTPTTASSKYSTPLSISATTTIKAIAVASGYANSTVASATYTIASSGPVSVNLSSADNVYGIVADGSAVPNGGLDGAGYAYSGNLLGTSISWSGATFTLAAAGTLNAVNSKSIALPAGNYSALSLLATAVNGNQANQTFIVTYSDGTTSTFTQSLSDWFTPQSYAAESIASTMAYRITPTGATGSGPCYLYGYSFALNSAKSVASIRLPNNRYVVVLAADLRP
jgi:hypothetical protein